MAESIELRYTTNKGTAGHVTVSTSTDILQIVGSFERNRWNKPPSGIKMEGDETIPFLDLNPLSKCKNLQVLELVDLGCETVDFSPLADCSKLDTIIVTNTHNLSDIDSSGYTRHLIGHVRSIELSPLRSLTNLRVLKLNDIQKTSLDLSPLTCCPLLEELEISGSLVLEEDGTLSNLDLTPLIECNSLQVIKLENLDLKNIDL